MASVLSHCICLFSGIKRLNPGTKLPYGVCWLRNDFESQHVERGIEAYSVPGSLAPSITGFGFKLVVPMLIK
jgi:hypothetical protein